MPGHNSNHFTGKTKSGDPRKNRKKKIRIKRVHRNKYKPFHITYKEVMQLKHINIVIIDGVERDIATLSAEERAKIVNELNRVAVGYLGYQKEKTA